MIGKEAWHYTALLLRNAGWSQSGGVKEFVGSDWTKCAIICSTIAIAAGQPTSPAYIDTLICIVSMRAGGNTLAPLSHQIFAILTLSAVGLCGGAFKTWRWAGQAFGKGGRLIGCGWAALGLWDAGVVEHQVVLLARQALNNWGVERKPTLGAWGRAFRAHMGWLVAIGPQRTHQSAPTSHGVHIIPIRTLWASVVRWAYAGADAAGVRAILANTIDGPGIRACGDTLRFL